MIDLPVSKGLSSSAAMCVAILAAIDLINRFPNAKQQDLQNILEYVSESETLTFYANMAYVGERKELRINCGQMDQYALAFVGILHIDCREEPAKVYHLEPKLNLPIVIGDTMQPKDTQKILGWLGERFRTKEPSFFEGMKNIVRIIEEAKEKLKKLNPDRKILRINE
ncbi:MAG: hypothetical protein QW279_00030 [Candidatus Jordarchaeaceae archaeon]